MTDRDCDNCAHHSEGGCSVWECSFERKKDDTINGVEEVLRALPSVQPEIIRCRDCKHRRLDGMIWSCPFGLSGGEDFFCAYGAKDGDSDDE